jgi:predicted TIM-barrel fold metal-dependent hydrolase
MAILLNHHPGRIFGGLTSVLAHDTHKMWYLGPEKIVELVECVGADKLIYGLDFPWNSAATNKRDIEIIKNLNIAAKDKEKILGGNLAALVGA